MSSGSWPWTPAGAAWEWIDREMVWVRVAKDADPEGGAKDGSLTRL